VVRRAEPLRAGLLGVGLAQAQWRNNAQLAKTPEQVTVEAELAEQRRRTEALERELAELKKGGGGVLSAYYA
jgi:cell division protein FtsB